MKGDFSTIRDRRNAYSRLLGQQGRVQLDSDMNEQSAIQQRLMRTLIIDLLGRAGGPRDDCGFGLSDWKAGDGKPRQHDFLIGAGRYYVDGILVENDSPVAYADQPHFPGPPLLDNGTSYLAYLDVWERHVTYLEDEAIREVALGGPDTCTRVQTVWQVRTVAADTRVPPKADPKEPRDNLPTNGAPLPTRDLPSGNSAPSAELTAAQEKLAEIKKQLADDDRLTSAQRARLEKVAGALEARIKELASGIETGQPRIPAPRPAPVEDDHPCTTLLAPIEAWTSGTMTARLPDEAPADTPCVLPIESRYRGLENHFYRIEIHAGGDTADANAVPTFKWSRENGSVATRFLGAKGPDTRVASARGLAAGNWVEISTEADEFAGRPGALRRVNRVEGDVLSLDAAVSVPQNATNPVVRRWDQAASDAQALTDGAIAIVPGKGEQGWIPIENGIEVQFSEGPYRTGDYWWITARVETGEIDWPQDAAGAPKALAPAGIEHHYAPLFMVQAIDKSPFTALVEDCRCLFARLPCLTVADNEKG